MTHSSRGYGDSNGEHLTIEHGRYSAWLHVVVAFAYTSYLWGLPLYFLIDHRFDNPVQAVFVSSLVGTAPAALIFMNRWRCMEAHTSQSLSGERTISLFYAPILATIYAHVRGARKLKGE